MCLKAGAEHKWEVGYCQAPPAASAQSNSDANKYRSISTPANQGPCQETHAKGRLKEFSVSPAGIRNERMQMPMAAAAALGASERPDGRS